MIRALLRLLLLSSAGLLCWLLLPSRAERPGTRPARATVAGRLAEYGAAAEARLLPFFQGAGLRFPPARITLIGLKRERRLELWASASGDGPQTFVRSYAILAASGGPGPKLREGDGQVPEGFYKVVLLNPNSRYHLSLRLGYPNAFDREKAAAENRTSLGGDIMIHGRAVSAGCLAMGDPAIEELFTLAARAGAANIAVILAPADFRAEPDFPAPDSAPAWVADLYRRLAAALAEFPLPARETGAD